MIQIGVTGHRFLDEIPALEAGIDLAVTRIARAYPGEAWSVFSSLAEGADRLVVHRILLTRPDARLIVPLPIPVPEYHQDFPTRESLEEFEVLFALAAEVIPPPKVSMRSEGYWLAGKTILERIDLLVALWDGQSAQGQGGTGEMVAIARQRGLPLAWVHCGNCIPGTNQGSSLGVEQGLVRFERFPQAGTIVPD